MTTLTITELNRIKDVAEKLDIKTFDVKTAHNGIGNIVIFSYKTFIEDYPATITVDLTNMDNW